MALGEEALTVVAGEGADRISLFDWIPVGSVLEHLHLVALAAAAIGWRGDLDDRLLGRGVEEIDASFEFVEVFP